MSQPELSTTFIKVYPHPDIPKPCGCVMLAPDSNSWMYEAWDGSERRIDLYQSPTEALQALLDYYWSPK